VHAVQLLRFRYKQLARRVNTAVELAERVHADGCELELISVVCHRGESANSGHYVCFRRIGPSSWCLCNDNNVERKEWSCVGGFFCSSVFEVLFHQFSNKF